MSLFTSIAMNVVEDVAVGALTGGTGLAVEELAGQVLQSAMSEGLSQLGSNLGLSSDQTDGILQAAGFDPGASAVDTATSAGSQLGFSPSDQAGVANTAQEATNAISQMLLDGLRGSGDSNQQGGGGVSGKGGWGSGMSVLEAIAMAMGKVMDQKLNQMASQANQLGSTSSQSSQYGQLTSEIQAESQELSMLSNSVSNAIKSIGDAGSTMAKKD